VQRALTQREERLELVKSDIPLFRKIVQNIGIQPE